MTTFKNPVGTRLWSLAPREDGGTRVCTVREVSKGKWGAEVLELYDVQFDDGLNWYDVLEPNFERLEEIEKIEKRLKK